MLDTLNLNKSVEEVIASYEAKIENIDTFFETTHLILGEFQDPLLETRQDREEINLQLENLLAQNEHLRRVDFNRMMQGVLFIQVNKEKEIRNLLNNYLTEQKQMVSLLRDNLIRIKVALANSQGVQIKEFKELISQILVRQDKRKLEVSLKLKEFQGEQKGMIQQLQELLAKGKKLRIKDLQSMLKESDAYRKGRLVRQEERKIEGIRRRGEVRDMLVDFKKKRQGSVKSWRTNLPKAISSVRKAEAANENNSVFNEISIDAVKEESPK